MGMHARLRDSFETIRRGTEWTNNVVETNLIKTTHSQCKAHTEVCSQPYAVFQVRHPLRLTSQKFKPRDSDYAGECTPVYEIDLRQSEEEQSGRTMLQRQICGIVYSMDGYFAVAAGFHFCPLEHWPPCLNSRPGTIRHSCDP